MHCPPGPEQDPWPLLLTLTWWRRSPGLIAQYPAQHRPTAEQHWGCGATARWGPASWSSSGGGPSPCHSSVQLQRHPANMQDCSWAGLGLACTRPGCIFGRLEPHTVPCCWWLGPLPGLRCDCSLYPTQYPAATARLVSCLAQSGSQFHPHRAAFPALHAKPPGIRGVPCIIHLCCLSGPGIHGSLCHKPWFPQRKCPPLPRDPTLCTRTLGSCIHFPVPDKPPVLSCTAAACPAISLRLCGKCPSTLHFKP